MLSIDGPYFENFVIGEEILTEGRTVTRTDVVNFAGVSGDFHPLHMDKEFGSKTVFGKNIPHGLCVQAIASGSIVRTGIFNKIVAFYGIDEWRFTKPVFFGDTIRARIKVENKTEKKLGGVIDLYIEIINQKDEILQKGMWKVMIGKKSL